ncbi:hypothetical protein [Streptomyces sp. HD]|uniref:hypothetical protein n=1 Tax=Streptomyces sp. HD TaxID=3020892 RepID=UPI00233010CD|nr:hypothetical protein [Streptomyces sp. HD]MDC0772393.1 hypothetical protein [Streptomyces sp. HD]
MSRAQDFSTVIHLDLRAGAAALHDPAALRARVAQELGRAGLPEPDDPLFLVVDTPAGLTDHQLQYELLTGYRAVGEVRLLVLLVGSAPGSFAGVEGGFQPDRRLLRPAVLRAPGTALLWAGDLRSARTALEQPEPDDPDALAVLVDVLSVPDVYLEVLDSVQSLPEAVAAPGVRLLEQDLPPEVRDRAWRDALTRFAGEDTELAPDVLLTASSGADLPEPLRGLVAGRGSRDLGHREPGGVADDAYRACADALDHAEDALAGLRTLPGLVRSSRRIAFETDVDEARQALDTYRDLVATALRNGGGKAPSAAESATRLAALGLRVPSAEGMGERISEGLREFAHKLLGQGLALRSVAQRFTGLAGRVEPLPGSALLKKLTPYSADAVARQTAGAADAAVPGLPVVGPLAAAGAGLLGALWSGPFLALALVVPLLFVGMAQLGAVRLRGAGRSGRWAVAPQVAAFVGAALGAAVGYATDSPVWMGTIGLLVGLGGATETVRRLWRAAAASWAPGHTTAVLRHALDGLDNLLATAVREHWAVEERLYCADAARSVAGMLRATAASAEAEAVPERERPVSAGAFGAPGTSGTSGTSGARAAAEHDWLVDDTDLEPDEAPGESDDGDWASVYAWEDEPAEEEREKGKTQGMGTEPGRDGSFSSGRRGQGVAPRWLERESGEGGPELVTTLSADLTDAALEAMKHYWGAVERGQAGARAVRRTEERVRELLSTARHHLQHNGVLAPLPFAAPRRVRASSANLLGTDPLGPAELVGAEAERQAVVQLSTPEQGTLLSRDPAAAVWLRFAPRAVRDEVEKTWRTTGTVHPEEVLWTSSGRYAGLVRLTPLRIGVIDTIRPRHGSGPDGPDPSTGAGRDVGRHTDDGMESYGTTDSYDRKDPYDRAEPYERPEPYDRSDAYARTEAYGHADPDNRSDTYDRSNTHDRADTDTDTDAWLSSGDWSDADARSESDARGDGDRW